MLSKQQLDEIEDRVNSITPGKWATIEYLDGWVHEQYIHLDGTFGISVPNQPGITCTGENRANNAQFIINAANDIRLLLEAVKQTALTEKDIKKIVREEITALFKEVAGRDGSCCDQ